MSIYNRKLRIVLLFHAGFSMDCSAELFVEPEGRDVEEDVKNYPGYEKSKKFLHQYLTGLGYKQPDEETEAIVISDD